MFVTNVIAYYLKLQNHTCKDNLTEISLTINENAWKIVTTPTPNNTKNFLLSNTNTIKELNYSFALAKVIQSDSNYQKIITVLPT